MARNIKYRDWEQRQEYSKDTKSKIMQSSTALFCLWTVNTFVGNDFSKCQNKTFQWVPINNLINTFYMLYLFVLYRGISSSFSKSEAFVLSNTCSSKVRILSESSPFSDKSLYKISAISGSQCLSFRLVRANWQQHALSSDHAPSNFPLICILRVQHAQSRCASTTRLHRSS